VNRYGILLGGPENFFNSFLRGIYEHEDDCSRLRGFLQRQRFCCLMNGFRFLGHKDFP
jgi:hypothetical protein